MLQWRSEHHHYNYYWLFSQSPLLSLITVSDGRHAAEFRGLLFRRLDRETVVLELFKEVSWSTLLPFFSELVELWPPLCLTAMPANLTYFLTPVFFLKALLKEQLESLETPVLMSLSEKNDLLETSLLFWRETMSVEASFEACEVRETDDDDDDDSSLGFPIFRRSFLTAWWGTSKNLCPGVRIFSGRTTEFHGLLKTSGLANAWEGYFSKILAAGIAI